MYSPRRFDKAQGSRGTVKEFSGISWLWRSEIPKTVWSIERVGAKVACFSWQIFLLDVHVFKKMHKIFMCTWGIFHHDYIFVRVTRPKDEHDCTEEMKHYREEEPASASGTGLTGVSKE